MESYAGRDERTRRRLRRALEEPTGALGRRRLAHEELARRRRTIRSRSQRSRAGEVERGAGGRRAASDYADVAVPAGRRGRRALPGRRSRTRSRPCRLVRERLLLATAFALVLALDPRPDGCGNALASAACGSSPRQSGLPAATSARRSSITATTRSASSRAPSTACAFSSRSSTTRARSSSRTPPTSCVPRCSRSEASWSFSRTRSSTRRRVAASSRPCRGRFSVSRSSRPTSSISRGSMQGSSRVMLEPVDLGGGRGDAGRRDRASWRRRPGTSSHGHRRRRVVPRRRCAHPPDRPRARDQRDDAHAGRDDGDAASAAGGAIARSCRSRTTGPGFPTSQREAVFGRFYRVEGGMASGSGLGLAIAREIARIMGGDVRLDSEGRADASSRSTFPRSRFRLALRAARMRFHVKTRRRPRARPPGLATRIRLRSRACPERRTSSATSTTSGDVRMVDVGAQAAARGGARSRAARVRMAPETARRLRTLPKGDALVTAQLAGIMAAKRTSELIPLCHPLPLTHVDVALDGGRRRGRDRGVGRDDRADRASRWRRSSPSRSPR